MCVCLCLTRCVHVCHYSVETMDVQPYTGTSTNPASSSDHVTSHDPTSEPEPEWMVNLRSVDTVLSGEVTVALHQEFLIRNNHTDLQILKNTKVSLAWSGRLSPFQTLGRLRGVGTCHIRLDGSGMPCSPQ